jgi:hypothetical protein
VRLLTLQLSLLLLLLRHSGMQVTMRACQK